MSRLISTLDGWLRFGRNIAATSRAFASKLRGLPLILDLNLVPINRCNQKCPMCNAGVLEQPEPMILSLEDCRKHISRLAKYNIPLCSISGGEPTLVPDMPEIIAEVARAFPRVAIISNFYDNGPRFQRVMETAIQENAHIVCSFDGFGEIADDLRGAKNVSSRVLQNIEMVSRMKRQMNSSSVLELHTVLCNSNVGQVPRILELSRRSGWIQSLAPVNVLSPQSTRTEPTLTNTPELACVLQEALRSTHVVQLHAFLKGISAFSRQQHVKTCPYLSGLLKTFKIFLEANGDISLCDRVPVGNLLESSLDDIFRGRQYQDFLERAEACRGCWLSCFAEPSLGTKFGIVFTPSFVRRLST